MHPTTRIQLEQQTLSSLTLTHTHTHTHSYDDALSRMRCHCRDFQIRYAPDCVLTVVRKHRTATSTTKSRRQPDSLTYSAQLSSLFSLIAWLCSLCGRKCVCVCVYSCAACVIKGLALALLVCLAVQTEIKLACSLARSLAWLQNYTTTSRRCRKKMSVYFPTYIYVWVGSSVVDCVCKPAYMCMCVCECECAELFQYVILFCWSGFSCRSSAVAVACWLLCKCFLVSLFCVPLIRCCCSVALGIQLSSTSIYLE